MRTVELWVDLYSHGSGGGGDPSDWPVWGQWRAIRAGRVLWQVSGFIVNPAVTPLSTAECRALFGSGTYRRSQGHALAEILFPDQVFMGRLALADGPIATDPVTEAIGLAGDHSASRARQTARLVDVTQLVAQTVDTLPTQERLAIGLYVDPALRASNEVPRVQLAPLPSERNRGLAIADRADVCIVQTHPSFVPLLTPPIPAWERIRILEMTASGASRFAGWAAELAGFPMVDVHECRAEDAQLQTLEVRPHVVICHDAEALRKVNLSSAYVVALPQPDADAVNDEIARLREHTPALLVMDDMASHASAVELLRTLCEGGTLTDALLGMHARSGGSSVTVCGRDLQLRLRAKDAPPEAGHGAYGRATAWVPLGDRLRASWEGRDVRIIALSGHTVSAQAVLKPAGPEFESVIIHGSLPTHVRSQAERRCAAAVAGQGVSAVVDVVADSPAGLDFAEATSQASEAAVLRALSGHDGANSYLVISENSFGADQPLPRYSPVTVDGVARASVPWQPDPARRWCCWNYRRDARTVEPEGIRLYQPIWPESGASPQVDAVIRNVLQWQADKIRNAFAPAKYPIAREFHPAQLILMSEGHLLWPSRRSVPHATNVLEGP